MRRSARTHHEGWVRGVGDHDGEDQHFRGEVIPPPVEHKAKPANARCRKVQKQRRPRRQTDHQTEHRYLGRE